MKYTIILIATVFLIGISESDAADPKTPAGKKAPPAKKAAPEKKAQPEKTAPADKGGKKKDPQAEPEETDPDQDDDATADEDNDPQATEDEEEEEDVKPKKRTPAKKKPAKPARRARDSDDDEEEEEEEAVPMGKKQLAALRDQAASMNPANLIAALQKTPASALKKVLPQVNKLANMLNGTPMGSIFKNLTSLLGNSSPEIWMQVFQAFPNFLATIMGTVAQLTAVGATAAGRLLKTGVDVADIFFNLGKDLLGGVTMLPGGNLLTPLGLVLDVAHGTIVDPADAIADELRDVGKRELKRAQRSMNRRRSGGAGGVDLFGGLIPGL